MCECVKQMDELLKPHNGAIVTSLLGTPPEVCIETYALKARGKRRPKVLASYCPFCGEKYPKETS